jgi:biopolymer transport protein ExbD
MEKSKTKIILFLLIGGFILFLGVSFIYSSTMSTKTAMKLTSPTYDSSTSDRSLKLYLPKGDSSSEKMPAAGTPVLHLLLVNEQDIFVYRDVLDKGGWTTYESIPTILKKELVQKPGIIVIITPFAMASYKNTVDVLDQMSNNNIKKFILTDPQKNELSFIGEKS